MLPDLGTPAARFSLWHVRPGEAVYEGDRVAEVVIPGVAIDLVAPASGVFAGRDVLPGDVVTAGQRLGHIEADA